MLMGCMNFRRLLVLLSPAKCLQVFVQSTFIVGSLCPKCCYNMLCCLPLVDSDNVRGASGMSSFLEYTL